MPKKIRPFRRLKANQCMECFGKLELVEEELYIAPLDSKGIPIRGDTYATGRLRCTKCGAEYDCEKRGMHYGIDFKCTPIPKIVKDFNPFYQ